MPTKKTLPLKHATHIQRATEKATLTLRRETLGRKQQRDLQSFRVTSNKNLQLLAESLPHIVWTANVDGAVDYFNQKWFEYTGLTPQQSFRNTATAVHPDDLLRYRVQWERAVQTGQTYKIEYRFRRASDGQYRWFLGRALPMRDEQGTIVKWFGTCTDIHDQKMAQEQMNRMTHILEYQVQERTKELEKEVVERTKAEELARGQLSLLKTMIASMPMSAAACDADLRILHANAKFGRMLTPPLKSAVGKNVLSMLRDAKNTFVHPEEYAAVLRIFEKTPSTAVRQEFALNDGRSFVLDYVPISGHTSLASCLLLLRDITREKRIDIAKSEFMSLASHQLRTPLTAVRWSLNRLNRHSGPSLGSDQQLLLKRAQDSIDVMAKTITTMLSISRIEAGKYLVVPVVVDLKKFCGSLCEEVQEFFGAKQQKFSLRLDHKGTLVTDASVLHQILLNLLSNASKYTPEKGRIRLTIRGGKKGILFEVQDTGYGIPKHERKKVFSKFFRAENILAIETEGTGLGLYLVRKLVEMLGGKIGFRSAVKVGTVFRVILPSQRP